MSDLISRQQAIDALAEHEKSRGHNYTLFVDIVSECAEIIRDLPPAQPEQKTGYWITLDSDSERYEDIKCPFCGYTFMVDAERWCDIGFTKEDFKFCPNCGAKME